MSESEQDGSVVVAEGQDERRGPERVVLRGVRAIVLDELPTADRRAVLDALDALDERTRGRAEREAWLAEAARSGQADKAIESYAGKSGAPDCKPGAYKAIPAGSWFVSPQVIEPPLG